LRSQRARGCWRSGCFYLLSGWQFVFHKQGNFMTSRLEHKRFENKFVWVPYYKRIGRFGSPLSNKIDEPNA
jgi:hypothetical protein